MSVYHQKIMETFIHEGPSRRLAFFDFTDTRAKVCRSEPSCMSRHIRAQTKSSQDFSNQLIYTNPGQSKSYASSIDSLGHTSEGIISDVC
jgi:hypothetical protein